MLEDGGLVLTEAWAIARHLDRTRPGPRLAPEGPVAMARTDQVAALIGAHGYWPMVRKVYAHAVFRPAAGEPGDPAEVDAGLAAAEPVLDLLEDVAAEGAILVVGTPDLAALHLAPVVDAFASAPGGAAALTRRPALAAWHAAIRDQPGMAATAAPLPRRAGGRVAGDAGQPPRVRRSVFGRRRAAP